MNNNNLTQQEVTILKTWKGETFEIDIKFEDFLIMERDLKSKGEDGFHSKAYRRYIKFGSIEHKIGKTKYLALEAPKRPEKVLTQEERQKNAEIIKKAMEETKEGRKKRFMDRRAQILRDLEKKEKEFGLETTVDKIQKLRDLEKKEKEFGLGTTVDKIQKYLNFKAKYGYGRNV